jgi:hypothetical protein
MNYLYFFLLGIALFGLNSCANTGTPTGGLKDEIPPRLLGTLPADQSVNVKGRIVELYFDEWIEVKSLKQNLQITPLSENNYKQRLKRNILTLEFEKDFEPNTTYTFEFGEAIQDITERNKAQNIRIAFSTGDFIDSLTVQGRVVRSLQNSAVQGAVVSLYPKGDTLDIDSGKPMYFTRTDSSGLYNLRNIKEGEYKIYALYEPKHNLIYQKNKQEIVAFLEAPLTIDQHKDSINFALTHYDLDTLEIGKMRARKQFFEVRTNKIFTNYSVKFDSSHYDTLIYHQQMEQNIIFFGKNGETDSVDLHLLVEDSLGMTAEQDIRIKINSVKKPAKIEFAHPEIPSSGTAFLPTDDFAFKLRFTKPVVLTYPDSISYAIDGDTLGRILPQKYFTWNHNKTLLDIKTDLKYDSTIVIDLKKGTFMSVENDSSQAKELKYSLANVEDFGTVAGTVLGNESHFILQILDKSGIVLQEIKNTKQFKFENIPKGDVRIRVLIDKNQNGKWDKGDFRQRIMPEKVIYYPEAIEVRANWEIEGIEIVL